MKIKRAEYLDGSGIADVINIADHWEAVGDLTNKIENLVKTCEIFGEKLPEHMQEPFRIVYTGIVREEMKPPETVVTIEQMSNGLVFVSLEKGERCLVRDVVNIRTMEKGEKVQLKERGV